MAWRERTSGRPGRTSGKPVMRSRWRTRTKTRIPPLNTWPRRLRTSITRSTTCCRGKRRSFIPPRTTRGITMSFSRSRRTGRVFDPARETKRAPFRSPFPLTRALNASPDLHLPHEDERDDQGVDDEGLDQREPDDHRDEDLGLGGRIAGNPLQPGGDGPALAERSAEGCDGDAKPGGQGDEGFDAVARPGGSPFRREGRGGHCYEEQCEQESEGNFAEHRVPPFADGIVDPAGWLRPPGRE